MTFNDKKDVDGWGDISNHPDLHHIDISHSDFKLRHLLGKREESSNTTLNVYTKCCNLPICSECLYQYIDLETPYRERRQWKHAFCYCAEDWAIAICHDGHGKNQIRRAFEKNCCRNTTASQIIGAFDRRPLQCFKCDVAFYDEASLCTHIFSTCPNVCVHCEDCDEFGTREYIMGSHYESVHSTTCHICGQRLNNKRLDAHLRTHISTYLESSPGKLSSRCRILFQ